MRTEPMYFEEAGFDGLRRLLIFLFFTGGAVFGGRLPEGSLAIGEGLLMSVYFFSLPLLISLLLSASVLGTALLPLCAFLLGALSGISAENIVGAYIRAAALDVKSLLINLILVPVFFVVAVKGMRTSSMLCAALDRSGVSARAAYSREYIPLIFSSAAAVLAVYLLGT